MSPASDADKQVAKARICSILVGSFPSDHTVLSCVSQLRVRQCSPAYLVRDLEIRGATKADASALADIYNPYVVETAITFEEIAVDPSEMAARVVEATARGFPSCLPTVAARRLGLPMPSKWKGRCAYRHTAETTVYVKHEHWRCGVGKTLYTQIAGRLQHAGTHAAIGGIALPNESSIALHERLGFTQVAHFREVGFKFNRWIDVGYWQLLFSNGDPE